ncbi:MAG: type IX secretion system membrane protein PorP/SprF [Flavobacteriales bacterium]|nr:type IX secretion system membrane protein PorP/SprF [Flavobacteriales bacterium]
MTRPFSNRRRSLLMLTTVMGVLFFGTASAQQAPQYTQYMFNQFGLNPAVAGSFQCRDFKLGYRTQWVGFDGAPNTFYLSAHGPLKVKSNGRQRGKHGIGAYINRDKIGPSTQMYINFAYAYHIKVQEKSWLSFGVFLGVQYYRFRANELITPTQDVAIDQASTSWVLPELMPGIWYTSQNSYAGLSFKHVLGNKLKAHGPESDLSRHYYLTAGRRFITHSGVSVTPSVMAKMAPSSPVSVDGNLMVDLSERVGLGASYRHQDALAALLRLRLTYEFWLGYSYDITTSPLAAVSNNTHEIVLSWSPCGRGSNGMGSGGNGKKSGNCPAYQ